MATFRGFSYIDLVEDSRTRRLYALKRISCHSKDDERLAMQEVEVMRSFNHPNLVPLEAHAMVAVGLHSKTLDITSEILIVMPFYKASLPLLPPPLGTFMPN